MLTGGLRGIARRPRGKVAAGVGPGPVATQNLPSGDDVARGEAFASHLSPTATVPGNATLPVQSTARETREANKTTQNKKFLLMTKPLSINRKLQIGRETPPDKPI